MAKKKKNKYKKHLLSVIRKKIRKQQLNSRRIKKKFDKKNRNKRRFAKYYRIKDNRNDFYKIFYRKRYKGPQITFDFSAEFGLEDTNQIDQFLEMSSKLIDFNTQHLKLNLAKSTYMWPSGITTLCSLVEFVELSAIGKKPKIGSSSPLDKRVNSYLVHSGFYDYVNRFKDTDDTSYYKAGEIVKIKREEDYSNIDNRENEIAALLSKYSCLTSQQIELFVDKVLIEIFNNVTEHGIAHKDKGFWLIAQYHPTHRIISISIADNGIGIRNSLVTGPQTAAVLRKISNLEENDGEFIKLTFEEYFSGALKAHIRTDKGLFSTGFESGANRGNGMKRIKSACKDLSIPLSILSQYGYLFIDENGVIFKCGAKKTRVFAGTLFHLKIKTKEF